MVDYLKAILLGVVEGITEWLPVSSTGHMILVNDLIENTGFTSGDLFLYVIQLGAILAVVTMYFKKLNPFSQKKTKEEKAATWQMWLLVIVGCLPAAVLGLLFNDYMESFENWQVVSATLIIYGIAFIVAENVKRPEKIRDMSQMSYKTAIGIGLFQVLSIIPGTSRSGATILGAIILGASRSLAAEYSFFMAIPIMFGVSFLKIVTYDKAVLPGEIGQLLLAMAVAYLVSVAAIKFLTDFVKKHDFKVFGWYRMALGLLVIGYFTL